MKTEQREVDAPENPNPLRDLPSSEASAKAVELPIAAPNVPEPELPISLNLVLLWLGQFISALGDYCLWIAIPLTVYNTTSNKVDLAFTAVTEGLPFLIFSPIAGVLVDRFDRRKTMIFADIGRAMMVGLLLVPHGAVPLWMFYFVLFCCSALSAFFMPARIGIMSQVVAKRQLMRVNALLSTSLQISETIGPAVAGFILAVMLQRGAFIADAISFVTSAVCIAGLSITSLPPRTTTALTLTNCIADLKAGMSVLLNTPVLRGMLIAWNVGYFSAAIFTAMIYAFARDILHMHAERYGFMLSCMGVGFLSAGIILATVLHKLKAPVLICSGLIASVAAGIALAEAHSMVQASCALFVFGFGGLLVNVPAQTLVQTAVQREMLGRFSGAFSMVARIAQIAGSAAAGYLAIAVGLRGTYLAVGALYAVSAVLAFMLLVKPPISDPLKSSDSAS